MYEDEKYYLERRFVEMSIQNCRVTVVCCYNNVGEYNSFKESIAKQSESAVVVGIDNTEKKYSSCAQAFNSSLSELCTQYVIFSHQDIEFTSHNTLELFVNQMETFCENSILGVAGAIKEKDRNSVYTNIVHGKDDICCKAGKPIVDEYGSVTIEPVECETVDECFFGGTSSYFREHLFDEESCDTWHLYAVEQCLRIRASGGKVYTSGIELWHKSQGNVTPDFFVNLDRLVKKYEQSFEYITTTCTITGTDPLYMRASSDLRTLEQKCAELIRQNQDLQKKLQMEYPQSFLLEQQLCSIYNSRSWKLTAPLRKFTAFAKENKIVRTVNKVRNYYKVYGLRATLDKIINKCTGKRETIESIHCPSKRNSSSGSLPTGSARMGDFFLMKLCSVGAILRQGKKFSSSVMS